MKLFDVSCDSTGDLKKDYAKARNIYRVPLTFTMEKDGELVEGLDDFSSEEEYIAFYEKVSSGWFPRTAKLNYEAHMAHFKKLAEAGVKEVIHFMISSGLANTVEITRQAAEDIKKEYPDLTVYPLDPLTATVGQGMLAGIAADLRDEGKTAKEAVEILNGLKMKIQHCIIPSDLFYLKKGGRVSAASATFGTMLNIKPLLTFDSQGKLATVEKCKGMKKAFAKVAEFMERAPVDERGIAVVVHTNNDTGAKELANLLESKFGVKPKIEIMGPVIGSHVGPGSVSCGWLSTKTREEIVGM
jgi:DegV family protein with EDD domain